MIPPEYLRLAEEERPHLMPPEPARQIAYRKIHVDGHIGEKLFGSLPLKLVRAEEEDPVPAASLLAYLPEQPLEVPPVISRRRSGEPYRPLPAQIPEADDPRPAEKPLDFTLPHIDILGGRVSVPLFTRTLVAPTDLLPELADLRFRLLRVVEDDDGGPVEVLIDRHEPVEIGRVVLHPEERYARLEPLGRE